MKATLYIIEACREDGGIVTHFTGSVSDARSEARDLSLKHKDHPVSLDKWQFFGKPKDVCVAVARCIQAVEELDEVTTLYSGKCTTCLIETTTYRRGRRHTSTQPQSDASEPEIASSPIPTESSPAT